MSDPLDLGARDATDQLVCPRYDYTVYGEPCQTCGKSVEAHEDATDRLTEALNILIERSRYVRADMHYELNVPDYRALEDALRLVRSSLGAARRTPEQDAERPDATGHAVVRGVAAAAERAPQIQQVSETKHEAMPAGPASIRQVGAARPTLEDLIRNLVRSMRANVKQPDERPDKIWGWRVDEWADELTRLIGDEP